MFDLNTLISLEKLDIEIGIGKASYKMSRGTFKTKDKILEKHVLKFVERSSNFLLYQYKNIELKIKVENANNKLVLSFESNPIYNRFWIHLPSDSNEYFYGCGEQFTHFNLKGQSVNIWVSEHHSIKKLISKFIREKIFGVNPEYLGKFKNQQTYYAQPSFTSSYGYFVHSDADAFQKYTFSKNRTSLYYREIPRSITLILSNNFIDLTKEISMLLGKQRVLPEWTEKGAIIASQGGIDNIRNKIIEAEKYKIHLVGVWCQDWSGQLVTSFGTQVYWNWEVDHKLYHDLKNEIQKMKENGIHFLGYINTFLKEDCSLYNEAKSKGFLVKTKEHKIYLIKSTTFSAGIVDLTHPEAYQWYKQIVIKNMIDLGMSGWMADFGEYLPTDSVIYNGNAEHMHNKWPQLWAQLNAEAIKESKRENELFFFTRAGYTETIKYTNLMWSGDQHVDFSKAYGLPSAIVSTLSMSTIGIGLNHSDIGGYTTILHMKRNQELLMRWSEMNIFTPLFRCHEGNKPQSNVQFNDNEMTLNHFSHMSNIYQKLSPYLRDVKSNYYLNGTPVNRPMFFHFNEDESYRTKYQFMYGSELLVAPVIKENTKVHNVYLPKGNWIQFITHQKFTGGHHEIDAPLGLPIAFYLEDTKYRTLFDSII